MAEPSSRNLIHLLTDDLFIDEILSRLDTIESIVCLSLVSRKLRTLCWCAPVMEVGNITYGIFNYLEQFFACRNTFTIKPEFRRFRIRIPELQCRTLDMSTLDFVEDHLLWWLQDALSLNVQELILEVRERVLPYHYELPCVKLDSYPLKHLRVLRLKNFPISLDRSFGTWVSTYCVSLEELHLRGVFVYSSELRITSSSLRVFTINAQFQDLHVSAPKLVTLRVMWDRLYIGSSPHEPNLSLRVSSTPNLQDFALGVEWIPISVEYFFSGDEGELNFPCLQSASLKFPRSPNIPSLKRLLLDISQSCRCLRINEAVLHRISDHEMIDIANSFSKLEELHVDIDESYCWSRETVMCFVKLIPSLKTFKLTADCDDGGWHDPQSYKVRKLRAEDFLWNLEIPAIYVDENTIKLELSPEESDEFLGQHTIDLFPPRLNFIFSYPN